MTNQEFINTISPIVQTENTKRGNPLFSSVVIAQAIHETGWGKSKLMMTANAIFGIKATSSWKGKVYNANTKECYDGITMSNINACFRAYNSLQDSIADYFDLITKTERYRRACLSNTPEECIKAIKNGGYATDPDYVYKIMLIIKNNNLTEFDNTNPVENPDADLQKLADDVIAGKYGNGEERKAKLGSLYAEVQKIVNERLKNVPRETIYVVKKGDCLCRIAKQYNTTVAKIAKDNNIENINYIFVGQKLIIK